MADYIFTMHQVSRTHPPNKVVLSDISLNFLPGAKIGILGSNGSGKSSLLRIMAGTDKEFRGALRKQLNMNVAAGQGTMEGKMFRISHMGYMDQVDTLGVIHGLEIILAQFGYKFEQGAGVLAAHNELFKLNGK